MPGDAGVLLRLPAGVRVQAGGQRGAAVRGVPISGVGGVGSGRGRRGRRSIEEEVEGAGGGG